MSRWPERCRLRTVGTSRAGRPLRLLSIGAAREQVLVVAGAHANESRLGGASIVELAQRVLADQAQPAEVTWNFLLCLDPDGAQLAESQTCDPRQPLDHFRYFYRQAADEQPEWAPSVGRTLPETRALLDLIDELRPFVQCSLHNSEMGGTFVQETGDIPGLAEELAKSAAELGIPLDLGVYDALYWPSPGPGVYLMPEVAEVEHSQASSWAVGTTTWHAPSRYGGVTAIVEVPLWPTERVATTELVADPAPSLVAAAEQLRQRGRLVHEFHATAARLLGHGDSPLLRSVAQMLPVFQPLADEWDPRVPQPGAPPLPPMTGARLAGIEAWAHCVPLRAVAMLHRALAPLRGGADELHGRLAGLVAAWCAEYQDCLRGSWLSVGRQVEQQVRIVQAAVRLARRR
ncbi:hydroxylacyl-CoA dehydrogenase [Kitasatospora sp. RB6PN24]|uniref:M14 family zinc carboxypeptidase n=1 Tax=Kitasatospora humi TaxID=2893891 RepID=UPI001E56741E|nr:M14 family zinc carboxypeptidase [Kitasatospora humi]MCC9311696.1 hydroxylacyl-CoA dehydrogenase [Kitasatospora humi]